MESSESFVYSGLFIAKSWRKRSNQIAKGHFLAVANKEMTLDRVLSKQQPRVISVLSYYLTSLVNLSFYGFDPASRSAQFSNCVFLLHSLLVRWPYAWSGSFRCGDRLAHPCIQSTVLPANKRLVPISSVVCFLASYLCYLYAICISSSASSIFTGCDSCFYIQLLRRLPHRHELHGIGLFALSREVLPVHWYHLLCLYNIT